MTFGTTHAVTEESPVFSFLSFLFKVNTVQNPTRNQGADPGQEAFIHKILEMHDRSRND